LFCGEDVFSDPSPLPHPDFDTVAGFQCRIEMQTRNSCPLIHLTRTASSDLLRGLMLARRRCRISSKRYFYPAKSGAARRRKPP
jgi:hypothetical protein